MLFWIRIWFAVLINSVVMWHIRWFCFGFCLLIVWSFWLCFVIPTCVCVCLNVSGLWLMWLDLLVFSYIVPVVLFIYWLLLGYCSWFGGYCWLLFGGFSFVCCVFVETFVFDVLVWCFFILMILVSACLLGVNAVNLCWWLFMLYWLVGVVDLCWLL